MINRFAAVMALFALFSALPATADDRQSCYSINSDDFKKDGYIKTGIAACARLIENDKGNNKKALAAAHMTRGYWLHRKGDLQASMKDYNRGLDLDPNSFEGYDYRADLWAAMDNDERALADYEQATRVDPNYVAAYYSRGQIFEKRGDVASARVEYEKAVALPNRNRIAEWAQNNARNRLRALGNKTE
jgi:tetratricopeptide (TPR) repeat protein